mmetsp:Transcript_24844/g.58289  ORF Transcript_24844/g.58289 Transcript_24844/m.58289 type:complete len:202 (-) Transcript_24844:254-859(-)
MSLLVVILASTGGLLRLRLLPTPVGFSGGILEQPTHMGLQLASVEDGRLGLVPELADVFGRQRQASTRRHGAISLLLFLGDFLPLLEFLFREAVPRKESFQLGVPTLQHHDDLLVSPVVHRNAPDLRDSDAQTPVAAAALYTDQGSVADGRPFGIAGRTIDTAPVAGKGVQQVFASHRKRLPVDDTRFRVAVTIAALQHIL